MSSPFFFLLCLVENIFQLTFSMRFFQSKTATTRIRFSEGKQPKLFLGFFFLISIKNLHGSRVFSLVLSRSQALDTHVSVEIPARPSGQREPSGFFPN